MGFFSGLFNPIELPPGNDFNKDSLKLLQSLGCYGTIFADVISQPLQILGNHLARRDRTQHRRRRTLLPAFAAATALC